MEDYFQSEEYKTNTKMLEGISEGLQLLIDKGLGETIDQEKTVEVLKKLKFRKWISKEEAKKELP